MKKKIACAVLGAMLLGLSLTACGNADNPSTGEITESGYPKREFIVAAIDSHDKTSAHEIEIFTNLVTERSGGAITFKVFYDNLLGKATDNLNTLSSGIADLGTVCTLYTPSNLPLSQITYCVPFAPDDPVLADQREVGGRRDGVCIHRKVRLFPGLAAAGHSGCVHDGILRRRNRQAKPGGPHPDQIRAPLRG